MNSEYLLSTGTCTNTTDLCRKKYSQYALPKYLAKHYWWAYLSPIGAKFFDYPFIVNRILWGQYHKISQDTVNLFSAPELSEQMFSKQKQQKVAGISCAYGEFFPKLIQNKNVEQLFLFDIAPIQIQQMQKKISPQLIKKKCLFFLSNAEQIALASKSVDSAILFFLLHELPEQARKNVLAETVRITKSGGRIIIADYAQNSNKHFFHRIKLFNRIFETLEPFLANFSRCDLIAELSQHAKEQGCKLTLKSERFYFNRFYRLLEFSIA